ncbi:MAG: cysteine protease StiP family protein [Clostridia bacterium]|nr:cysteine protease StiP family protein [Clostridia bacterium]
MLGTFDSQDVTVLLKDITGLVEPMSTSEREIRIQNGIPYCEMLPIEYEPSVQYMEAYKWALKSHGRQVAQAAANAALGIQQRHGSRAVLVSLARAGTTAGILIRRYAEQFLQSDFPHYTISIIRGVGIDKNAMRHILKRHAPQDLQFVDGWTGKGAILQELRRAVQEFAGVDPGLAVLADPACIASVWGTREDLLIPGSCLNSTVCGLLSRTFLRPDIIGPKDFHGAAFYQHLRSQDLTDAYLAAIEKHFPDLEPLPAPDADTDPAAEVTAVQRDFGIRDVNHIKPGIGEATRVLLRRLPWKILVHSLDDIEHLGHLYALAAEKGVPVELYPLRAYRACGLIREFADV